MTSPSYLSDLPMAEAQLRRVLMLDTLGMALCGIAVAIVALVPTSYGLARQLIDAGSLWLVAFSYSASAWLYIWKARPILNPRGTLLMVVTGAAFAVTKAGLWSQRNWPVAMCVTVAVLSAIASALIKRAASTRGTPIAQRVAG